MTTLPATIPGLVRRGSPVIDHAGDKMIACELVSGIGARCLDGDKLHGYTFRSLNLDIADPTGFHHALLWLAEKLGMDASAGAIWRKNVPWEMYELETSGGIWGFRRTIPVKAQRMTVVDIDDDTPPAEALRLAVLAVAGVEG